MPQRETGSRNAAARRVARQDDGSLAKELAELKQENLRLQERLEEAEAILDIQLRTSRILGIPSRP